MIKKICPNFTHLSSCTLHKFESLRGIKAGYRLRLISLIRKGRVKRGVCPFYGLLAHKMLNQNLVASKFSFLLEKQLR